MSDDDKTRKTWKFDLNSTTFEKGAVPKGAKFKESQTDNTVVAPKPSRPSIERKLKLEDQGIPTSRRRTNSLEDTENRLQIASYKQRITGGAIDLGITIGLFMVASMPRMTYYLEDFIFKVTTAMNLQIDLSDSVLDAGLIAINFLILYFLIQVTVTMLFQKSVGKFISKSHLVSFDADRVGLFQSIKREMILKPIGVIFLVGFILPFFDEDNQSFHDRYGGTLVGSD